MSWAVAPHTSEHPPGCLRGSAEPAKGTGQRHLSLRRSVTEAAPRPWGALGGPRPGVGGGLSPQPPNPEAGVGAAALLPEERPSCALYPAAPAARAQHLRPNPNARSLGHTEQRSATTSGTGEATPPAGPAPRRTHRASLVAGSALLYLHPRLRDSGGSLGGCLGCWVKGWWQACAGPACAAAPRAGSWH